MVNCCLVAALRVCVELLCVDEDVVEVDDEDVNEVRCFVVAVGRGVATVVVVVAVV